MTRLDEMLSIISSINQFYEDESSFGEEFNETVMCMNPILIELSSRYSHVPSVYFEVEKYMRLLDRASLYHSLNKN